MANIVLVHGAWQGAWVWQAVSAGLQMHDHHVITVELPGSGSDPVPIEDVTLASYTESIQRALEQSPGPAYLVGHSMGGIAISQAAEAAPGNIVRLVYLCAFLPRDEDTLMSLSALLPADQPPPLEIDDRQLAASFAEPAIIPAFMADTDPAVAAWAASQFKPQALAPLGTPLQLTAERYASVPRDYIVCLEDHVIDPRLQRLMIERTTCDRVFELDAGHCPFLSMPSTLTSLLHKITSHQ